MKKHYLLALMAVTTLFFSCDKKAEAPVEEKPVTAEYVLSGITTISEMRKVAYDEESL